MVEPLLTHRKIEQQDRNRGWWISPGERHALFVWRSQRATCVLLWWSSVLRWRDLVVGAGMEQENLCLDTVGRVMGC